MLTALGASDAEDRIYRYLATTVSVTDDEIRAGIQLLARTTGVFAETAGGVTIAVLRKLSESGALDTGQETVVYNTGDGLKTLDAVSDRAQLTTVVPPTVEAIRTAGLL